VVTYSSGGENSTALAVADVNGDGKPDLIVANTCADGCSDESPGSVGVLLGNGDGTFQVAITYSSGALLAASVAVADINGDGIPDILAGNSPGSAPSIGVLLGNGDGTFEPAATFASPSLSIVVADVNGDGKPDIVTPGSVFLGNGNGTFQDAMTFVPADGYSSYSIVVADVNGDGKPDIVAAGQCNGTTFACDPGVVGVLLGNGNGTFQTAVTYTSPGYRTGSVTVADVNGDGIPDIVATNLCATNQGCSAGSLSVLLGNGDGTFQPAVLFSSGVADTTSVAIADVNGDGKPDLLVANSCEGGGICGVLGTVSVLLNTSISGSSIKLTSSANPSKFAQSVTFTATVIPHAGFYKGPPTGTVSFLDGATKLGSSALNSSGAATFATSVLAEGTHSITASYAGSATFATSTSPVLSQVVQGAVAQFSPASIGFGNQTVDITSTVHTLTLKNAGNVALTISSITITGTDSSDFTQTHSCGTSIAAGSSCTVSVTFKPAATGTRTAAVSIADSAPKSPQTVPLSGVGVLPAVTFSPTSLTFPSQIVFTTSAAKTVTLTNSGLGVLKISSVAVAGPFAQTNNCGATVNPAASCTLTVTFKPTTGGALSGTLSVTDNALSSPEKVTLKGTGSDVQLTPTSEDFGTQPKGTSSLAKTITLSNKADTAFSMTSITIAGANPGDFSQTNTCGTTVASGASCFIKVVFKPTATGSRTAEVSISDTGGGSPQTASLTGTGT
jgi:trimeric autotransporter adhesin